MLPPWAVKKNRFAEENDPLPWNVCWSVDRFARSQTLKTIAKDGDNGVAQPVESFGPEHTSPCCFIRNVLFSAFWGRFQFETEEHLILGAEFPNPNTQSTWISPTISPDPSVRSWPDRARSGPATLTDLWSRRFLAKIGAFTGWRRGSFRGKFKKGGGRVAVAVDNSNSSQSNKVKHMSNGFYLR